MKNTSIAIIANAAGFTGSDWEMIAPYGDHPTADGKRIQRFGKPQAETMVRTFNSLWHRLGTGFRGVPIFHGHPDVDPQSWPDDRRLGKVIELEAREDGLWGKPEYNALGKDNAREGWWIYPSPAWLHPRTNDRVVVPDELLSIGMTNTPNISGSQPWANSAVPTSEEQNESEMKEKLCALYGLDPATATDEDILAAAQSAKTAADAKANADTEATTAKEEAATAKSESAEATRKMEEANSARTTAEARVTTVLKDVAEVLVNSAITSGKLTEAERETTTNSFLAKDADVKKIAKEIHEKKVTFNTASLELGGKKVAISTARERQAAVQSEVNSRMTAKGISYDAAYKEVKADPQFARLFEAMKQPGEKEDA